ncbi:MAG TPA: DUF4136 domain-containing protein [Sphingobacteriaceae bacterium]|nr:DUF4136 domain-containing protein [Sphingobacteriaceae bacterium]
MKKLRYLIPLVLLIASCSSQKYHTTRIVNQDFLAYNTYGWLTPIDSLSKNYFNNDIAKANIMETANAELEARGMTYSKENPDILFRYIVIVNNRSQEIYGSPHRWYSPWGWYYPRGWGYGYAPYRPIGEERFRVGHLIIEARDRQSNTVIWQARGSGRVDSPEKAINNLPKVVKGVLAQYPVKASK